MTANINDLREKYRPKKFADFVGNQRNIRYLKNTIAKGTFPNGIIFHGPPGSGKTSLAYLYGKSLSCLNFEEDICGNCENCIQAEKHFPHTAAISGIHAYDCTRIDEKRLEEIISHNLMYATDRIKNPHIFDEFHRIRDRGQDKFLKLLESKPAILFIFCLIDISSVEEAFKQRVTILKTLPPEMGEIVPWLQKICNLEGIIVEDIDTLQKLAEQAHRLPRECLGALEKISCLDEPLTIDLVKEIFADKKSVKDDPPAHEIIKG
jgi:DNA polymerase-3 subunit gamma/tau